MAESNEHAGPLDEWRPLPPGTSCWILSDGRAGHEAQTLGLADALFLKPQIRRIAPRRMFELLAPFGPADPKDMAALAPPFPDIVVAAGRRAIPCLRRIKRASGGLTFTVYINTPATGRSTADLIVAPRHDGFFAPNVVNPITPPNRITLESLARLRGKPDRRIAKLRTPRVALLIGGDSKHFKFTPPDAMALADVARALVAQGASVMATTSRRTPIPVARAVQAALKKAPAFLWDGRGENPYLAMLANADAIVVTADSVNMIGEAAATGAPVHIFAPTGGSKKIAAYLASLKTLGAVRPWEGRLESWRYDPVNATPMVANAVTRAYRTFRGLVQPLAPLEEEDCEAEDND